MSSYISYLSSSQGAIIHSSLIQMHDPLLKLRKDRPYYLRDPAGPSECPLHTTIISQLPNCMFDYPKFLQVHTYLPPVMFKTYVLNSSYAMRII